MYVFVNLIYRGWRQPVKNWKTCGHQANNYTRLTSENCPKDLDAYNWKKISIKIKARPIITI